MMARMLAGSLTQTPARSAGPSVACGFLDHFRAFVTAIDALEENPAAIADARGWSPLAFSAHYPRALASGARDDYSALSPISRRAFDAVAGALNSLAAAVLTLCEAASDPLSEEELAARHAILLQLHELLDRAAALVETSDGGRPAARRPPGAN
jgi:hypothetical protein